MCNREGKELIAKSLLDTQIWLELNSRDVLDESDEILNVMYQLVYSSGKNSLVNGGQTRWEMAQDILMMAEKHFKSIKDDYGNEFVELNESKTLPQAYPKFRLLNFQPFKDLSSLIIEDYCNQNKLIKSYNKSIIKKFLMDQELSRADRESLNRIVNDNKELKNRLNLLRGYFGYRILYFIFNKSFRVDYGVNFKTYRLLQAVPYRAKDVPAERAQFSHVDVFILLTILNYYYSGINKEQFKQILARLDTKQDNSHIYEKWITDLKRINVKIPETIEEYCSLNFSDSTQMNKLYDLVKIYPPVINFWLNNFLFPIEAKEFTEELSTSAWDLCDIKPKPITGFSGTNDSRYLLPLGMSFLNIDELSSTNGSLLFNLLKEENNFYDYLKSNENDCEILNKINKIERCNLLLDVGALMVSVSNEELCKRWLSLKKSAKAAVYFDNENNLSVLSRDHKKISFELSPYVYSLEGCVIYLDEYHTRGTDLKIPKETIGAVTLGKNVTKDRLMQACMRMRMLGDGHSVRFFASFEVHNQIRSMMKDTKESDSNIGALRVLEWTIEKSRDLIINGFLLWALQGLSYYKRQNAYDEYKMSLELKVYYKRYKNDKNNSIERLYENNRIERNIKDIVMTNYIYLKQYLSPNLTDEGFTQFETKKNSIIEYIKKFVDNHTRFANFLEDEQEIELENEQEQERELELYRPKRVEPSKPNLEPDVIKFLIEGVIQNTSKSFKHLLKSFDNTSVYEIIQENAWSSNLYATNDFIKTVEYIKNDDYLKIPRWISVSKDQMIVFISGYELNQFIYEYNKEFYESKMKYCCFMGRNRQNQKRLFDLNRNSFNISGFYLEQIGIYSGSLYLKEKEELNFYLSFLGYCPRPRKNEEESYFDAGQISDTGYVKDKSVRSLLGLSNFCKFDSDPMKIVRMIAEIRNFGLVPDSAHHLIIINYGNKPILD